MPYTLGIHINGARISDEDAKIIALLNMGLTRSQISAVLFIKQPCIDNKISALYGLLGTRSCINDLMRISQFYGFNLYGFYYGKDVLSTDERRRLEPFLPGRWVETVEATIICTPKK